MLKSFKSELIGDKIILTLANVNDVTHVFELSADDSRQLAKDLYHRVREMSESIDDVTGYLYSSRFGRNSKYHESNLR